MQKHTMLQEDLSFKGQQPNGHATVKGKGIDGAHVKKFEQGKGPWVPCSRGGDVTYPLPSLVDRETDKTENIAFLQTLHMITKKPPEPQEGIVRNHPNRKKDIVAPSGESFCFKQCTLDTIITKADSHFHRNLEVK